MDRSLGDFKEDGGLGAHLMQEDEQGKLQTIGLASWQLQKHEKNYSAFLLELQVAVFGIEYFHHYLHGCCFVLYNKRVCLPSGGQDLRKPLTTTH